MTNKTKNEYLRILNDLVLDFGSELDDAHVAQAQDLVYEAHKCIEAHKCLEKEGDSR